MKPIYILLILLFLSLCALYPSVQAAAQGPAEPDAPAGWGSPTAVSATGWPELLYFSINNDATRLVGLERWNSSDDHDHNVVVSEYAGGAWQPPTVIAANGVYATGNFIWMPQWTHPIISGDGDTIVYLGWTGETNAVYVVDRLPAGGWSAPALIDTGLGNTHYWISLSQDGRTLALASYSFEGGDHVYVLRRTGDVWSALTRVSAESGPLAGGRFPSLSGDGRKLVYIQNARALFTEQIGGQWTAPLALSDNSQGDTAFPQMSRDGRTVIYWLIHPIDSALMVQDLYVLRRDGSTWGAAERVNTQRILPITDVSEAPAASNDQATRLIYARPLSSSNTASDLLISEWRDGVWQESQLVATDGWIYNWWPRLAPDGMTLTFEGSNSRIWQMQTDTPPTLLPLPTSTTATITPDGGELVSEIDQTHYDFAPGTFTETVQFTHVMWSNLPPPPPNHVTIDGSSSGLSRGFEATATLSPGGLLLQAARRVTVTIDYDDDKPSIIIPGSRSLWRLAEAGWVQLPGADNPEQTTLTTLVDHFSYFAVFGETRHVYLPTVVKK